MSTPNTQYTPTSAQQDNAAQGLQVAFPEAAPPPTQPNVHQPVNMGAQVDPGSMMPPGGYNQLEFEDGQTNTADPGLAGLTAPPGADQHMTDPFGTPPQNQQATPPNPVAQGQPATPPQNPQQPDPNAQADPLNPWQHAREQYQQAQNPQAQAQQQANPQNPQQPAQTLDQVIQAAQTDEGFNWGAVIDHIATTQQINAPEDPLSSIRQEIQQQQPHLVLDTPDQFKAHLNNLTTEHANLNQAVNQWGQLMDQYPQVGAMVRGLVDRIAQGQQVDENAYIMEHVGSKIQVPEIPQINDDMLELLDENGAKEAYEGLKNARDKFVEMNTELEKAVGVYKTSQESRSEAEQQIDTLSTYMESGFNDAVVKAKESLGYDDNRAMLPIRFMETVIFGDQNGNRYQPNVVYEIFDMYLNRDNYISRAEHERLVQEQVNTKIQEMAAGNVPPPASTPALNNAIVPPGGAHQHFNPQQQYADVAPQDPWDIAFAKQDNQLEFQG